MGWVDAFRGNVVGLDTAPIIYLIEENPTYLKVVDLFFKAVERGEIIVITSIMSLLETLVHPIRNADVKLAQKYRDILLDSEGFTTVLLDQNIAEEAAQLRAFYSIRTPDSIQMATAIIGKASFFLTNDKRLPSLPNLKILMLDDLLKEDQKKEP